MIAGFTLDHVVPWGRSFDEYRRMFALTDGDLKLKIVGCADGPASFNAEATRLGSAVISCDPIYRYDAAQLRERIASTYDEILEQTRRNTGEFVWSTIHSVDELGKLRMSAMNEFLRDYPAGLAERRYIDAELPHLPFNDTSFDLALCSHFLFLYTTQLGEVFHRSAIREICRVAVEVRIFPLLALGAIPSPLVERTVDEFGGQGFDVSLDEVPYEFQRGGNKMMRIRRTRTDGQCDPAPDVARGQIRPPAVPATVVPKRQHDLRVDDPPNVGGDTRHSGAPCSGSAYHAQQAHAGWPPEWSLSDAPHRGPPRPCRVA